MSVDLRARKPTTEGTVLQVGLLDDCSIGRKAKISRCLALVGRSYRSVTLSGVELLGEPDRARSPHRAAPSPAERGGPKSTRAARSR